MSGTTLEYLDPTSPKPGGDLFVPAIGNLRGKVIGFLNNGWSSFTKIGARLETILREQHGIREVKRYDIPSSGPPVKGLLDTVARECDAAVVGMAN